MAMLNRKKDRLTAAYIHGKIIEIACIYCFGKENAKKSSWIARKLATDYNIHASSEYIRTVLQEFPRGGFISGQQGGLYIIATKEEAAEVIAALELRAKTHLESAQALRELYNLK